MAFLERPGAKVFYEIIRAESGPAVGRWMTLVNGHTRTSTDFKLLAKFLSAKGWNVLVLDNRGCGKTEAFSDFVGQDMVDDVVGIWDAEGIAVSGILGVSMGGMIVQYLALRYPSRVSSVVLVSTTSHKKHVISTRTPWVAGLDEITQKLKRYFAPAFAESNKLLIDAMAKGTLRAMAGGRFQTGVEQQSKAMLSFDDPADFSQLTMPFLVLHGESDQIVDPEAAREFGRMIRTATVKTYSEVGHLILAEAPKRLYEDVAVFLDAQT